MENESFSRKERRELHRQEQRQSQSSGRRSRVLRRVALWGIGLAIIGGIGWGMTKLASNVTLPTQNGVLTVPVSATDHFSGPENASIVLVEYSDYQCPACGAFYPVIKKLLDEPDLKGKVKFVYRNFPLTQLHANAQLAAQAAEAAAVHDKFWEMHAKLFEGQTKWSGMSSAGAREVFMGYARELSINTEWFAGDLDSSAVKQKIKADQDGGLAAGVNATPTFFVNGKQMPSPQSYDQFKQYLINGVQ